MTLVTSDLFIKQHFPLEVLIKGLCPLLLVNDPIQSHTLWQQRGNRSGFLKETETKEVLCEVLVVIATHLSAERSSRPSHHHDHCTRLFPEVSPAHYFSAVVQPLQLARFQLGQVIGRLLWSRS